jgi:hypothetical protein
LQGYHNALVTHPHHNYDEGRAAADITAWLAYFLKGMATVFEKVAEEVRASAVPGDGKAEAFLRRLDRRGRMILGLFERHEEITANDVAGIPGLSPRQLRDLLNGWVGGGLAGGQRRSSKDSSLSFIGGITAGV